MFFCAQVYEMIVQHEQYFIWAIPSENWKKVKNDILICQLEQQLQSVHAREHKCLFTLHGMALIKATFVCCMSALSSRLHNHQPFLGILVFIICCIYTLFGLHQCSFSHAFRACNWIIKMWCRQFLKIFQKNYQWQSPSAHVRNSFFQSPAHFL